MAKVELSVELIGFWLQLEYQRQQLMQERQQFHMEQLRTLEYRSRQHAQAYFNSQNPQPVVAPPPPPPSVPQPGLPPQANQMMPSGPRPMMNAPLQAQQIPPQHMQASNVPINYPPTSKFSLPPSYFRTNFCCSDQLQSGPVPVPMSSESAAAPPANNLPAQQSMPQQPHPQQQQQQPPMPCPPSAPHGLVMPPHPQQQQHPLPPQSNQAPVTQPDPSSQIPSQQPPPPPPQSAAPVAVPPPQMPPQAPNPLASYPQGNPH